MKNLVIILSSIFSLGFLGSCQNNVDPIYSDSAAFNSLLNRLRLQVPEHPYILDPSIDNQIITPDGSVIDFPAYSFRYASGDTVKTSSVYVMVIELINKSDIVMAHSTSMTTGYSRLESGGQLRVTAQDVTGQSVDAVGYTLHYSAEHTVGSGGKSMGLFRGSVSGDSKLLLWDEEPIVADTVKASLDSLGSITGTFYSFFDVDGLGWTNLDRFTSEGLYDVNISLSDSRLDPSNSIVYFVLESELSVGTLNGFNTSTMAFFNEFYQFPNTGVKFIVIAHVDGVHYWGATDYIDIGADMTLNIDVNATSEEDIIEAVEAL